MKINKILNVFTIPLTLSFLSPIVCCAKTQSEISSIVLEEFGGSTFSNAEGDVKGICSIYRESKKSYKIVDYLKERITKILGYNPKFNADGGHNLWFDLAPTKGFEKAKSVVIQGHTDMVLDYANEAAKEEAIKNGIHPVIDGQYVHSDGNKTSLGADNGIGIAIALAMIKNNKDFNHGLIRFIFSADEESGVQGALYAQNHNEKLFVDDSGKAINYLINVDAEPKYCIYRSCAGGFDPLFKASITPTGEEMLNNKFELYVDGLMGGHSGNDMELMRFNADRLIFEFLNSIIDNVQIVRYDHLNKEGTDIEWKRNQIVKNGHVVFATNLQQNELETKFNNLLENKWKPKYSGENWQQVTSSFNPAQKTTEPFLCKEDSKKIISFVGSNDDPHKLTNGLYYGVYDWIGEGDARRPKSSTNISPFYIKKLDTGNDIEISLETYTRETDETLYPEHRDVYIDDWRKLFGTEPEILSEFMPWTAQEPNVFGDLVMKCYRQNGVQPWYRDTRGGVEPAVWTHMNTNLQCVCIGPEIRNAHTVDEILTIDTIVPVYKTIIDTIKELG